ncbi:MAG TPA: electron transfer flavoprotein subunit alpha/FixB family protein [Candidatus Acidoferrales bacterium]|nr:electron transfer flavoprotein subunit alpha/FixB family protein [Candidatus Acidoferrales bacterium]
MADTILVIAEQRQGKLNRASLETLAAGQQLAEARGAKLVVALPGKSVAEQSAEFSAKKFDELYLVEHDLLEPYSPDGYAAALRQLIEQLQPALILFPHTYQVRDFAPKLAAGFQRSLLSDCIGLRIEGAQTVFVRQMFQGKTNADVLAVGTPPVFVSFQAGAFRADQVKEGGKVEAKKFEPKLSADQIRSKPEEPFREAKQAVDLTQAERIVAVGRGIKEPQNLEMAKKLAALLGAELAASRPICDEGWLPMERQIGSSGQTVAPKLYLALGISGAIQHVVGMKGARTVVAINKDANAPIFEVADYGIVGDLFEIVPALIETLEKGGAS